MSGGSGQSNWGKNNWGGSCFHCKAFSLQLHMMVCYYFFLSMLAELLNGFRFQGQVEFFFCEQKKKKKKLMLYFLCAKVSVQSQELILPVGTAQMRRTPSEHTNTNNGQDCLAPFLDAVLCF